MDYICREAIIDDLEKEIEAGSVALDEDVWINRGLRIAIRDIKDIKSSDVQRVKHGRWSECYTDNRIYSGICSVCGGGAIRSVRANPLAYCPNCGAKMDGK